MRDRDVSDGGRDEKSSDREFHESLGREIANLKFANADLKADNAELLEILAHMVSQHCHATPGGIPHEIDSCAITVNADAMHALEKRKRIEVVAEYGRRVLANWTKNEDRME